MMNETSKQAADAGAGPFALAVDGHRIAGRTLGQGRPVLLLHSLLADAGSFDRVLAPLAVRSRLVVPDLPGFGLSDRVDGNLDAVADRLAAFVPLLKLSEPPILLGNGYGGFVALTMAIRHPGLARGLVLSNCGAAFSEPGRAAFRGMSAAAREHGLAAIADVAMRRLFAPSYQAAHPELVAERRRRFLETDLATFHQACADLAALDLRPALAGVDIRVLVLAGEVDEATPPPMARELAAGLPRAALRELPGCAHVPQLQAPDTWVAAVREFLS